MNYIEEIENLLYLNKKLGFIDYGDGAMLIGHVPHVAPAAYLHRIYSPLNNNDITLLENLLQRNLPNQFKSFLLKHNGISFFLDSLYLYGLEKNSDGRLSKPIFHPFSILIPNTIERPKDAEDSFLFIGGYGDDGSKLYIDDKTGKVFHCERYYSKKILKVWPNIEIMLLDETKRISKKFDENGKEV